MARSRATLMAAAGLALTAGLTTIATVPAQASGPRPNFQVPFACGQTWAGETRTSHSPLYAIDFNHYDAAGTPDDLGRRVMASAGGVVDKVVDGGSTSYGNYIVIRHGNGWKTLYAHLKEDSWVVSPGQSVTRGQKIAQVGNSGGSSSPHLHYEQIHDGSVVKSVFYGDNEALYFGTRNYNTPSC